MPLWCVDANDCVMVPAAAEDEVGGDGSLLWLLVGPLGLCVLWSGCWEVEWGEGPCVCWGLGANVLGGGRAGPTLGRGSVPMLVVPVCGNVMTGWCW